ncbi:aminoacyl tRNA synthase complex-interacting multifunctional protein 1-like [Styela clava]
MAENLFVKRAKLTDEKIKILTQQVEKLKQKAIAVAIEKEEQRLKHENERLKEDVENLKTRLIIAEIKNGKMQVQLPSRKSTGSKKNVPPSDSSKPAQAKSNVDPDAKKQKSEKPSKKKAAAQKPKGEEGPVDVSRLDFRIGRIVKAEKHPDADSLYIEDVETGEEKNRTVISGLVKFIPIEEMQNRMVILMMNLKPVKMRGILSQAMVMCASSPDKIEILVPPPGCVPGDRVTFEGHSGEPDAQLNPKKKVWDQVQPDLKTDANRVACYKGIPFTVPGKGICTAPTMANSAIK